MAKKPLVRYLIPIFFFLISGCADKPDITFKTVEKEEAVFLVPVQIQANEIRKLHTATHWGDSIKVNGFRLVDDSMNKKIFSAGYDGPVEVLLEATSISLEKEIK